MPATPVARRRAAEPGPTDTGSFFVWLANHTVYRFPFDTTKVKILEGMVASGGFTMARRTVAKDGPHPVDVLVGRRARERRTLEGMSQTAVAEKLGLTYQQMQKYERGLNRISASRLYELTQIFDVPVSYFYEGMEAGKGAPSHNETLTTRETLELVKAYYAISDPVVRDTIRKLVQAFAKLGLSPDTGKKPVRRNTKKATSKAGRPASTEFDSSTIDGRTKVGKAALAALKKRSRKSKADLEAMAAVG